MIWIVFNSSLFNYCDVSKRNPCVQQVILWYNNWHCSLQIYSIRIASRVSCKSSQYISPVMLVAKLLAIQYTLPAILVSELLVINTAFNKPGSYDKFSEKKAPSPYFFPVHCHPLSCGAQYRVKVNILLPRKFTNVEEIWFCLSFRRGSSVRVEGSWCEALRVVGWDRRARYGCKPFENIVTFCTTHTSLERANGYQSFYIVRAKTQTKRQEKNE